MSMELFLTLGVVALAGVVAFLLVRGRKQAVDVDTDVRKHPRDDIDTVVAWPPEVTRLLTGGERAAHEVVVKALPECLIFAQVPLARFIKVSRRHSYAEWLTRVGHLCADFVVCDRASLVIAVVLLQSSRDSERSERRRARMARVLKAAGVKVFQWREEALPSAELARDQIVQRTGIPSTAPVVDVTQPRPGRAPERGGPIPVPEVVAEVVDDGQRREPPSSTWFDDLDSGRVPLDPPRQQPKQAGR
jgi:hypothetical protein